LLELIVKTGIADAIAQRLGRLGDNTRAIAETIENNVRRKIIKESLNDPAFFETMSELLDEIIGLRRTKAIEYEEYLQRIADLARRVEVGVEDDRVTGDTPVYLLPSSSHERPAPPTARSNKRDGVNARRAPRTPGLTEGRRPPTSFP